MTTKECIVANFKKVFINTGIPCNMLFGNAIKEHIGINCEISERTNESLMVKLLFDDMPLKLKCTFRNTQSVTKFISKIEIVE